MDLNSEDCMRLNLGTLADVLSGSWVTVAGYAEGSDSAMMKLLALGIIPGDRCKVLANYPTILFEVGSACYAIDSQLAAHILVYDAE